MINEQETCLTFQKHDDDDDDITNFSSDNSRLLYVYQHSLYIWVQQIVVLKVKVKFTLEQATKTQSGSRVIILLFI